MRSVAETDTPAGTRRGQGLHGGRGRPDRPATATTGGSATGRGGELRQTSFDTSDELLRKLGDDEDLRLGFYREWVDPKVDSLDVNLFISLDLSTQTDELGIWNSNSSFYYKRYFAPFGKNFMGYSRKVSRELGYSFRDVLVNGISPEGGKSWETFVPGEISVNSELVLTTGTPALAFVTVNDARFLVDTPLDRAQHIRYDNLSRQIRALAGMFHMAFEDPELFPRLQDAAQGHDAVPEGPDHGLPEAQHRSRPAAHRRRRRRAQRQEEVLQGRARRVLRGRRRRRRVLRQPQSASSRSRWRATAWTRPPDGSATRPTRGIQGDQAYPMLIKMDWRDKEWMVVLFPCQAFNFFDIVDPRYLTKLSEVTVFDETNASPVEYGYTIGEGPSAKDEPVGVLFARPGALVKMGFGAGILGFRSLLLNSENPDDKEEALGAGFAMEPGSSFARTSYQSARDMWTLDEARMRELRSFAIENQRLNDLHERARGELERAAAALERKEWSEFVRHTRSAIGLESRAYPDVKSTQERRHPGHHLLHGPGPALRLLRRAPADHRRHDPASDHGLRRHLPRHLDRPLLRPPGLRAVQPPSSYSWPSSSSSSRLS